MEPQEADKSNEAEHKLKSECKSWQKSLCSNFEATLKAREACLVK